MWVVVTLLCLAAAVGCFVFAIRQVRSGRSWTQPRRRALTQATYLGGLPGLPPGRALVSRDGTVVHFRCGLAHVSLPATNITALRLVPRSQVVNTGGGRSVAGAAVGAAIGNAIVPGLGLVAGAVAGARKRTKLKTVHNDVVVLQATNQDGAAFEAYFAGGSHQYQGLARAMGLSL